MHNAVWLNIYPFSELGTSVRQPKVIRVQHANSIRSGLLDSEICFFRPRCQVGSALGANIELSGETADYPQACVRRAGIDNYHLYAGVVLIHQGLKRRTEPTIVVVGRDNHG